MGLGDLILSSRRVVLPDGVRPAAVTVGGGVVTGIDPPDHAPPGVRRIDLGAHALLPGLVDTHVHVNEPGRTEWEGFRTATRAAAAGGITTVVDMPLNSTPVTTSVAALEAKRMAARGQCLVDVGFWGGLVPGNADGLDALLDAGALGAKCFLSPSGLDDFPAAVEADLRAALARLAPRGAPLLVHAEDPAVLAAAAAECGLDADPRSYSRFLASRPPEAEVRAIEMLARLCAEFGAPVHIVHVSAAASLETIRNARRAGHPLTAETCPHYLCLAAEAIPDGAPLYKCAPPIRDDANRERLWRGLESGDLDLVASDHSPCPPGLKALDTGDLAAAWGGISSLQLGLPLVWTEARRRGHDLDRVAHWMGAAPARLAGLDDRKGAIRIGVDADLVVFDAERTFDVDPRHLHHRHPLTPYTGRTLHGVVVRTLVRGRTVFDDGAPTGDPAGRFLSRRADAELH